MPAPAPKAGEKTPSAKASGRAARASGPAQESASPAPELWNGLVTRGPGFSVQAKLNVGAPDDPLEHEADRVADHVMRMPMAVQRSPIEHRVQRVCAECAKGGLCPKCAAAAAKDELQRTPIVLRTPSGHWPRVAQRTHHGRGEAPSVPQVTPDVEANIRSMRGGGSPLGTDERTRLESHLGADLSRVRLHTNTGAASTARALDARAFTVGSDIFFGGGEYSPNSGASQRLLAHELTHVVQQGEAPASLMRKPLPSGTTPAERGGGLSDEDFALIAKWLESTSDPLPAGWTLAKGLGVTDSRVHSGPPESFTTQVCPSCHKTPSEILAERQRLAAEAHQRDLEDRWPSMHKEQHAGDLAQQGGSLADDIEASKLAVAQVRMQLFERVLARNAVGNPPAGSRITPTMRDNWLAAEQTTVVLESLLATTSDELPAEFGDQVRRSYRGFFESVVFLFATEDFSEKRSQIAMSRSMSQRCPTGSCHQPAQPRVAPLSIPSLTGAPSFLPGGGAARQRANYEEDLDLEAMLTGPDVGPRSGRLTGAKAQNEQALSRAAWKGVIAEFRWATSVVDEQLRSEAWSDPAARETIEQFDYVTQLQKRQETLRDKYPEGLKVRAIFYPRFEFTKKADENGATTEVAKGIPWQFYLTRTQWDDPHTVPSGYTWELHDLTAPRRDDRTVVQKHTITTFEALGRERGPWSHPTSINDTDPPRTLYEALNHKDFFPEGELYWVSPISGKTDHIETTASATLGDWFERIGMTIGILSLFFPPIALAGLVIGAGLATTGRMHRLYEKGQHGILTQGDVNEFYWGVALDVVSIATLGFARIAVAAKAVNALRLAASAERMFVLARGANIVLSGTNLIVITAGAVEQYRAIEKSNMTPEQKRAAEAKLVFLSMVSGTIQLVGLLADLRAAGTDHLIIDVDPHTGKPIARLNATGDMAEQMATRPDGQPIARTEFVHPVTGERHTYALWSDGRITRCSTPPCMQIAESVIERLNELRQRAPQKAQFATSLNELGERARLLKEEAAAVAAGPKRGLSTGTERVLAKTREIERDIAKLERTIGEATGWRGPVGGGQASKEVPGGILIGRVTGGERLAGTSRAPLDWPIVRVDNAHAPDVVPEGIVLELPNGDRVWRTIKSDRGIVIEGRIGDGGRRQGSERNLPSRKEMGPDYAKTDLERGHSKGASMGENKYAIRHTPSEVNQELQNLGIEEFMRTMRENPLPGVQFQVTTNTRTHPDTLVASLFEYSVAAVHEGGRTTLFTLGIRIEGQTPGGLHAFIDGDLTSVHPEAAFVLPINDLATKMLERRLAMFQRTFKKAAK
jgi:hypothetical protein